MTLRCKWMVLVLAMITPVVWAQESISRVKIKAFSVTPLEARWGDELCVRWQVQNVGDKPITVYPRVGFAIDERTRFLTAQPRRIAPSEVVTFSTWGTPEFKPYPGEYVIYVSIHEADSNLAIAGYVDSRKLWIGPIPKKKPEAQAPAKPAIVANVERPLYFPGETVSVRGQIVNAAKPAQSILATGVVTLTVNIAADGQFSFDFPVKEIGRQKLVLEAEDLPRTTIEFSVAGSDLTFPRIFGTDRTYGVGLYVNARQAEQTPYYANALGANIIFTGGYLIPNKSSDELFTSADRLGMTVGYISSIPYGRGVPAVRFDSMPAQDIEKNVFSADYQKAHQEYMTNFVQQMRHHPSLRYILVLAEGFNLLPEVGYNPDILERFAEEVFKKAYPDIELPAFTDPGAWYKLLRNDDDRWELWLSWRERTWTDYFTKLRDVLRAIKPDIELGTIESNFMSRGLWNLDMLVERGVTVHGPSNWFPTHDWAYWSSFWARQDRLDHNFEPLMSTLSIYADINYEPEEMVSGLFGIIKAGGTPNPTWCDTSYNGKWEYLNPEFGNSEAPITDIHQWVKASPGSLQSVIADMVVGNDNHRKSEAFERAAFQIRQLPYKDRYGVYERQGGSLPLNFEIQWQQAGQQMSAKSNNGTTVNDPHDPVYATVQDYQANGYVEMLLFNDVAQRGRTRVMKAIQFPAEAFVYEPGSLEARDLTITITCEKDAVPFIDGAPWLYYDREGDRLTLKSVPFQPQQIRLLQLVRCGRDLPHVNTSAVKVSHTAVNLDEKTLWLKLSEPQAGSITADCADWGEPKDLVGGKRVQYDSASHLVEISADEKAPYLTVAW